MANPTKCALISAAAMALAEAAYVPQARADLLQLENWNQNTGAWLPYSKWLSGDFNGDGNTDLVYLWACYPNGPGSQNGPGCSQLWLGGPQLLYTPTAADFYISCTSWNAPACPAGVPNGTQSGSFVRQPANNNSPSSGWDVTAYGGGVIEGGCNGIDGTCQWVTGDYDGDGFTDLAFAFANSQGQIEISVDSTGNTGGIPNPNTAPSGLWANDGAGWVGTTQHDSTWLAGDFDGDGFEDLAYVFNAPWGGGGITIDVRLSTRTGFSAPQRWAGPPTGGGWIDLSAQQQWVAADFNGDGLIDLGHAWDDNGGIDLDVFVSGGSQGNGGFSLQRWATGQGSYIASSSWTAAPAILWDEGFRLEYATAPQSAYGAFIYAFNDWGGISIDAHQWNGSPLLGPVAGNFFMQRYATQQGTYPDVVQFLAGDFNGDHIGDVADPWAYNGQIMIDVHAGTCAGAVLPNGQCCGPNTQVCAGACAPISQNCFNPGPTY